VMDAGGVDAGTHDELLRRHALYADLHARWSAPHAPESP